MVAVNLFAYLFVLAGAAFWGVYGIFHINLVELVFQEPADMGVAIVCSLIAISALWLLFSPIFTKGDLRLQRKSLKKAKATKGGNR